MTAPFDRQRLAEREQRDALEEALLFGHESPGERVAMSLALCDVSRALARAASAPWILDPPDDLSLKSITRAVPFRIARG